MSSTWPAIQGHLQKQELGSIKQNPWPSQLIHKSPTRQRYKQARERGLNAKCKLMEKRSLLVNRERRKTDESQNTSCLTFNPDLGVRSRGFSNKACNDCPGNSSPLLQQWILLESLLGAALWLRLRLSPPLPPSSSSLVVRRHFFEKEAACNCLFFCLNLLAGNSC